MESPQRLRLMGVARFYSRPAIEFAVVPGRASTDTAGTPPVARAVVRCDTGRVTVHYAKVRACHAAEPLV